MSTPRVLPIRTRTLLPAALLAALISLLALSATATADGGISPDGSESSTQTTSGSKAKLVKGKAIAPENAPRKVKRVIAAANEIRKKPYRYGGGHGSWNDSGYDCSGAVSYALHGAKLLKRPLDSSGLARYGKKKRGEWITVFGASSHAYMVVAGLRFDTSMVRGDGPGWSKKLRSTPENYKARHPRGL